MKEKRTYYVTRSGRYFGIVRNDDNPLTDIVFTTQHKNMSDLISFLHRWWKSEDIKPLYGGWEPPTVINGDEIPERRAVSELNWETNWSRGGKTSF